MHVRENPIESVMFKPGEGEAGLFVFIKMRRSMLLSPQNLEKRHHELIGVTVLRKSEIVVENKHLAENYLDRSTGSKFFITDTDKPHLPVTYELVLKSLRPGEVYTIRIDTSLLRANSPEVLVQFR